MKRVAVSIVIIIFMCLGILLIGRYLPGVRQEPPVQENLDKTAECAEQEDPAEQTAGIPLVSSAGEEALPLPRGFADDFSRSPGHGIGEWDIVSGTWEIEFSFDPNRIPNQYALKASAGDKESLIIIKEQAWRGIHLAYSFFPLKPGVYGIVTGIDKIGKGSVRIMFEIGNDSSRAYVSSGKIKQSADITDKVRLSQWHRIEIKRWGWILQVLIDEQCIFTIYDLPLEQGRTGLFARSGEAVFDDVAAREIIFIADNGNEHTIPWKAGTGAEWFRYKKADSNPVLTGVKGGITFKGKNLFIQELFLEEHANKSGVCSVESAGLIMTKQEKNKRFYSRRNGTKGGDSITISSDRGRTHIMRVGVGFSSPLSGVFREGPYTFKSNSIEDPSDYLDFTQDEIREMKASGKWDKYKRQKKMKSLVGRSGSSSVWVANNTRRRSREPQKWAVSGGMLKGSGPGAVLSHAQEIISPFMLSMKIKNINPDSIADIDFYASGKKGVKVRISDRDNKNTGSSKPDIFLTIPDDDAWHLLSIKADPEKREAYIDDPNKAEETSARGGGGRIIFYVSQGSMAFDDIEFSIPRKSKHGYFYAFDRRETDWWREGNAWIDHGGIACVLASSWISLVALEDEGMIWNKRTFESDVAVAFTLEENSEWYGWSQGESHKHYPFDNIRVVLSDQYSVDTGYRLELNSKTRSMTVLYKNGKQAASVPQTGNFPMKYRGGHSPYSPRSNRIMFVKREGVLSAFVNGVRVLTYKDPDPLEVTRVGIGGYKTRVNFSHIEIRNLGDS
jgi:hypothetical protein